MSAELIGLYVKSEMLIPMCVSLHFLTLNLIYHSFTQLFISSNPFTFLHSQSLSLLPQSSLQPLDQVPDTPTLLLETL